LLNQLKNAGKQLFKQNIQINDEAEDREQNNIDQLTRTTNIITKKPTTETTLIPIIRESEQLAKMLHQNVN
jgi:hypothetical protein